MKNTLAYYGAELITVVKCFLAPERWRRKRIKVFIGRTPGRGASRRCRWRRRRRRWTWGLASPAADRPSPEWSPRSGSGRRWWPETRRVFRIETLRWIEFVLFIVVFVDWWVSYSALFTFLVRWHASTVSLTPSDVTLAQPPEWRHFVFTSWIANISL